MAPYLGAIAPIALAVKYVGDKAAEIREKKEAARSLMDVLAAPRNRIGLD